MLESENLFYRSVPFVFWSTQASKEQIKQAYKLQINGFFIKENRFQEIKASLTVIVEYWLKSVVPD